MHEDCMRVVSTCVCLLVFPVVGGGGGGGGGTEATIDTKYTENALTRRHGVSVHLLIFITKHFHFRNTS